MKRLASIVGGLMAIAGLALAVNRYVPVTTGWQALAGDESRVCKIKGNISFNGERIYHIPGQAYYAITRIDVARGERWFCSEAEARAAGWRKARDPVQAVLSAAHGATPRYP